MTNVTIRDLSEETIAEVKIRAARNRQSMQAYLKDMVETQTAIPPLDDVIARIRQRATARLSADDVVSDIDKGRQRE